jgi:hypothetical protein
MSTAIVAIFLLFLLGVVFYQKRLREYLSPNPLEMSQMQQGRIKRLIDQLSTVELTEDTVDALQEVVETNVQNTSDLQANMEQADPNGRPDAYPADDVDASEDQAETDPTEDQAETDATEDQAVEDQE